MRWAVDLASFNIGCVNLMNMSVLVSFISVVTVPGQNVVWGVPFCSGTCSTNRWWERLQAGCNLPTKGARWFPMSSCWMNRNVWDRSEGSLLFEGSGHLSYHCSKEPSAKTLVLLHSQFISVRRVFKAWRSSIRGTTMPGNAYSELSWFHWYSKQTSLIVPCCKISW